MKLEDVKKESIVIGYIHNGLVHEVFFRSIFELCIHDQGPNGARLINCFTGSKGLYLADNRNRVVHKFLSFKAEWLLFVDTDIEFPSNILDTLLLEADSVKSPIVSALYYAHAGYHDDDETKRIPFRVVPAWYTIRPDGGYGEVFQIYDGYNELDGIGMGCCLIHRSVFEKFLTSEYGKLDWVWFGHDETVIGGHKRTLGEDLTFCRRAKQLGFNIIGAGKAMVNHYKYRGENLESYLGTMLFYQEKFKLNGGDIQEQEELVEDTILA